ncbi:hypothetical protein ACFXTH_031833 [Malus domestica]
MTGQCEKKVEKFQMEEEVAVCLAKYIADLSTKFVKERASGPVQIVGESKLLEAVEHGGDFLKGRWWTVVRRRWDFRPSIFIRFHGRRIFGL